MGVALTPLVYQGVSGATLPAIEGATIGAVSGGVAGGIAGKLRKSGDAKLKQLENKSKRKKLTFKERQELGALRALHKHPVMSSLTAGSVVLTPIALAGKGKAKKDPFKSLRPAKTITKPYFIYGGKLYKGKLAGKGKKSDNEMMMDEWYNKVEEGLGRKLTKKEKSKEKRLMI
jgi:Na+/glutamate symporter